MSSISRIKANQMLCTGSCLFVLAGGLFGFGYVLGEGHHRLGSLLSLGAPYWASLATFLNGIVAIVGGIKKTATTVALYVLLCVTSCGVEIYLVVCSTNLLRDWRRNLDCPPATCPYDEVSVLLLSLICVAALSALMSLAGFMEVVYAIFLTEEGHHMVVQHKSTVYSIPLVTSNPSRDTALSRPVPSYLHTANNCAGYGRPRKWELRSNDSTFHKNKVLYAEVTV